MAAQVLKDGEQARGTHLQRGVPGGQVVLQPGQGTDVPPGGPPKAPALWGEARRRDAIARTTI